MEEDHLSNLQKKKGETLSENEWTKTKRSTRPDKQKHAVLVEQLVYLRK